MNFWRSLQYIILVLAAATAFALPYIPVSWRIPELVGLFLFMYLYLYFERKVNSKNSTTPSENS